MQCQEEEPTKILYLFGQKKTAILYFKVGWGLIIDMNDRHKFKRGGFKWVDRWTSFKQGLKWFYNFWNEHCRTLELENSQWRKFVAVGSIVFENLSWTKVYVKTKLHLKVGMC